MSLLVAALSWAASAQAQSQYPECDRKPTEGDIAAAKGAFQAGQASFNEADYDRAITYWEDAYRRDCTAHALLLNLARAYELNGQKEQAIAALETYQARNPGAAQDSQIRRRIEKLRQQIQVQEAQADPAASEPIEAQPPPQSDGPLPDSEPLPDAAPEGRRPLWPLFVAGGGGVIFAVSGLLYLDAQSDVSSFEDLCGPKRDECPSRETQQQANDARGKATRRGAVSIVGLAIAGGGVLLYFLLPEESSGAAKQEPKPRLSPAVAPGYAGLSLSGAF